eukprot:3063967-Karenia_brevis.AAC.1
MDRRFVTGLAATRAKGSTVELTLDPSVNFLAFRLKVRGGQGHPCGGEVRMDRRGKEQAATCSIAHATACTPGHVRFHGKITPRGADSSGPDDKE